MAKKQVKKYGYSCKLDRVVDGDTCDALIDLGFDTFVKKRIRFYGVDTWESRTRNLEEKKKGLAAKAYVKDLLENSDDGKFSMFFDITLNNIRVSFMTYVSGITAGIGTVWMLFKNGIMLGTFQTMFYQHGLLTQSFLVVYIHGTIELSSLVIAGASGLMLGSSILFPGTDKRLKSLIRGGKSSVKIAIGLVPLFTIAGFLEGFVTRYADMPDILKVLIIVVSFCFIVFYFLAYPFYYHNRKKRLSEW